MTDRGNKRTLLVASDLYNCPSLLFKFSLSYTDKIVSIDRIEFVYEILYTRFQLQFLSRRGVKNVLYFQEVLTHFT